MEILAKFEPPDLVLLDIILPVIFISAMDRPSDEKNGHSLGVDDYIPKPFPCEMVLKKVRVQLTKSGKGVL